MQFTFGQGSQRECWIFGWFCVEPGVQREYPCGSLPGCSMTQCLSNTEGRRMQKACEHHTALWSQAKKIPHLCLVQLVQVTLQPVQVQSHPSHSKAGQQCFVRFSSHCSAHHLFQSSSQVFGKSHALIQEIVSNVTLSTAVK